jgi:hypothetical protein
MVCNLRCLDPASSILLYNNSGSASLLEDQRFHCNPGVLIHPAPRRHRYAGSHGFMLDCLRWACRDRDFDTVTNVDSDQLLLRPGYSQCLAEAVAPCPNLGMLKSGPLAPGWPTDGTGGLIPLGFAGESGAPAYINQPQLTALNELHAWAPFLTRHDAGGGYQSAVLRHFPRWSFWPGVVFTRRAALALLDLYDGDLYLRALLGRTQIFAAEEIVFPTLLSLMGLDLVRTPFDEACVRFRTPYTLDALEESLRVPDRFWMHPVPRDMDDPLRARLREHYRNYHQD